MAQTLQAPLTIEDCKKLLPGVKERTLRETINKIGCASKIGGQYFLDLDDFKRLMEECKLCPSNSKSEPMANGTSQALLTANATGKALELIRKKSQSLSSQKPKAKSKKPPFTELSLKPHSQTQQ